MSIWLSKTILDLILYLQNSSKCAVHHFLRQNFLSWQLTDMTLPFFSDVKTIYEYEKKACHNRFFSVWSDDEYSDWHNQMLSS